MSLLPAEFLLLLFEEESSLLRVQAAEFSPVAEPQLLGPGQTGTGEGQQLTVSMPLARCKGQGNEVGLDWTL